jgi:hypothetical protein
MEAGALYYIKYFVKDLDYYIWLQQAFETAFFSISNTASHAS